MEIESITSDSDQLWYGKENILWENSFFVRVCEKNLYSYQENLKATFPSLDIMLYFPFIQSYF